MTVRSTSWRRAGRSPSGLALIRRLVLVSATVPAVVILYLAALLAAEPLFTVRTPIMPSDILVIPGGDAQRRATRAAGLYREGLAPAVLVTGNGDCREARGVLIAHGVPDQAIIVECDSGNTWENARFSASELETLAVDTAILVTDWFHSRRAMACFRAAAPAVRWSSAPVPPTAPPLVLARRDEGFQAVREYLKIPWYAVRYGVSPILPEDGAGWPDDPERTPEPALARARAGGGGGGGG